MAAVSPLPGSDRRATAGHDLPVANPRRSHIEFPMPMTRDKLILLDVDFEDPAFPGQRFYCWHCVLIEGLLTAFPDLATRVDVVRTPWPRPRQLVVDLLGPENQSLPVLVLADDASPELANAEYKGRRFIAGKDAILNVLASRHGIPHPHP